MKFDMHQVAAIVREVGRTIVLPRWRNLEAGDICEKTGPNDLVTVVDRASEQELAKRLTAAYPGTIVVGEEGVEADPDLMKKLEEDAPVWITDPIDGTFAFSHGHPQFDVMLALVEKGELLGGWIYAPVDDVMVMGEKGGGAFYSVHEEAPQKLRPVADLPLEKLTGILGKKFFSDEKRAELREKGEKFGGMTGTICAGHDYTRLLRGAAQFAIYNKCMPWDHVPGLAIASELGFTFTKHDGSPYMPWDTAGGLIVGPRAQQAELRKLFFG